MVKFLKLAWKKKTLKNKKLHGLLLINMRTLVEKNILVTDSLLYDHELKNCEIF